jgi:hypothetical protein
MHGFVSPPDQSATHPCSRSRGRKLPVGWLIAAVAAAAWTLSACVVGQISEPSSVNLPGGSAPGKTPGAGGAAPGGPAGTTQGGPAITGPGSKSPATLDCSGKQAAAPAPLARLTNLEYRNTVLELFPGITIPEVDLPADNVVEGFDNNAKAQTPSPTLIEQYRANAQAAGAAVAARVDVALPCKATTAAEQDSCGKQWIDTFTPRAYRRPITADERVRLNALFASAKTSYGFNTAVSMVVQAVLQSSSFLYRVELGGPAKSGVAALSGYELASRLSYFFWDSMPDKELTDAAASGALDTATGVEDQARRLLDDPKAHDAVASFFRQWLRFDKMNRMEKSATLYPAWNEDMAASLRTSTEKFVDRVFWDMGGSLNALLTDSSTFVDANIAPIYGLPATGAKTSATSMTLTDTNPAQRSGILTQAGLMAAFAHETTDSPVLRGVFVLDRLLCSAPPPPPPGVTGSITETTGSAQPMTTRDRFALTHEAGECASCHHTIDGFGFGFEHYDAIGKWRETENGFNINAKGWIVGTRDADGEFDGAVELGQRLAQSTQVSDCVASQWFRYSLGLGAADVNSCDVAPATKAFTANDGDMRELMIATVMSDAFRRRPEVKL